MREAARIIRRIHDRVHDLSPLLWHRVWLNTHLYGVEREALCTAEMERLISTDATLAEAFSLLGQIPGFDVRDLVPPPPERAESG